MKSIHSKRKEIYKALILILLLLALLFNYILPFKTVFAADMGDITVNATFNGTGGEIVFNDGLGRTSEGSSYNGVLPDAGYTDASNKNKITINTSFGDPIASKITINGVEYNTNNTESNEYEVDGAASYTISIEGDSSVVTPKTIIWTNPDFVPVDEEEASWVSDFSIGHGYARAIEVYDNNNQLLRPEQYINNEARPDGSRSDEYGLNKGFGWVSIMPGYRVVFEFVPEYGYQLTGININGEPIDATDVVNRFEFTMPNSSGNVHFGATFTRTEDIVRANSSRVSSGTINLGNDLSGGSAQLTINDANLSADKITGFQNAAAGFTISNYIDIDLYNVFYKGKNDANDVWSNQIEDLDEYATITLQLQEGVNANDIEIVHNIHDGDQFEVIPIDSYDPATNTITFRTRSFSSYALATRGSAGVSSDVKTTTVSHAPLTKDEIFTIFCVL